MRIHFKISLEEKCQVRLVFDSLVEAVHHFKTLVSRTGTQAFTAQFFPEERLTMQLIPFFGGSGITFENLDYNHEEFLTFCESEASEVQPSENDLRLYFGFEDNGNFMAVNFEENTFVQLQAYSIN